MLEAYRAHYTPLIYWIIGARRIGKTDFFLQLAIELWLVYNKKTKTAIKYHADYHWYRQDRNGKWSHKRGTWAVCNTDSKGKSINNPQKAKKNYETSLFPYIPGGPPYEMHNGILYSVKNVVEYNGNYGYYVITKK